MLTITVSIALIGSYILGCSLWKRKLFLKARNDSESPQQQHQEDPVSLAKDEEDDGDDQSEIIVEHPYTEPSADTFFFNPSYSPACSDDTGMRLPMEPGGVMVDKEKHSIDSTTRSTDRPNDAPTTETESPTVDLGRAGRYGRGLYPKATKRRASPPPKRAIIETGLMVGMRVLARRPGSGDSRFEGVIRSVVDEYYTIDFGISGSETIPGGSGNVIRHPGDDELIFRMRTR